MFIIKQYTIDYSLMNGLGHPSISIYLTGCDAPIKCVGCHNWELQARSKVLYNFKTILETLDNAINNFLQFHSKLYVSFLGGEPLTPYNRELTQLLSKYVKNKYPDAKTVVYTWRTLTDIQKDNLGEYLKYMDYGVLGEFKQELYVPNILPSSTNQYIYNFKTECLMPTITLKGGTQSNDEI